MRFRYCIFLSLALLVAMAPLISQDQEQDPNTGFPPSARMETHQGYPDHADVISHRRVMKDTHAKCISVEHHPGKSAENAACVLRYDTGENYQLDFKKSMRFPKDGEVYLECLGSKPTSCVIGLW